MHEKKRRPESAEHSPAQLGQKAIRRCIELMQKNRFVLHIPAVIDPFKAVDGMHFHPQPELFLQVAGISVMQLPREIIRCRPGEAMLMPRGMPHTETIAGRPRIFCNLVISFGRRTVTVHEARHKNSAFPRIVKMQQFAADDVPRLYGYLDEACYWQKIAGPVARQAANGLLAAHLAALEQLLLNPLPHSRNESMRTIECRRLVSEHLTMPQLNVAWLADRVKCNPDYLSFSFHKETGISLAEYINQKRLDFVRSLLDNSHLTIAEAAHAAGYNDPGYMTRRFRRAFNCAPREYRKNA